MLKKKEPKLFDRLKPDVTVHQNGLLGFQGCRGSQLRRMAGHIHIIRTIWAQTYSVKKNRLMDTLYIKIHEM